MKVLRILNCVIFTKGEEDAKEYLTFLALDV